MIDIMNWTYTGFHNENKSFVYIVQWFTSLTQLLGTQTSQYNRFGLLVFQNISTLSGYSMLNPVYIYKINMICK